MNSKYEMIYKDYQESGLKLKEYCLLNNLNYHNTETGILLINLCVYSEL